MPGPGPHMIYALGSGLGLMHASRARFSPHHCLFYAANAFLGPDLGSFAEWLSSTLSIGGGSILMHVIHDPFYYILVLGLPFSLFYSWLSKLLLHKGFLDTLSGVPLTRRQCLLLVSAGSLSHFFLDHLFEENGHSSMYTWILSTGWWKSRAPIDPDAVVVVGFLCSCLIGGFIYINRLKPAKKLITVQTSWSMLLVLVITSLYCLWCVSQIYWRNPAHAAIGEEADLGVLVFLAIYFFLPHCLCITSMNPKDYLDATAQLPM
ncbi:uncharacterized protein LOC131257946 isoform X1 [Magnolia sinica]|uniref:uncharacterized protein LOC131257946 isoform X1 n=1 Tax=Magnolia sinica TaxID=86752 RepID=UPI002659AD24|nr:uncharacterized protein LOC131257946 isoform X1 [Magnolia sinica]